VARGARHTLVRVSAVRCAAETRQIRKVQDLGIAIFNGVKYKLFYESRAPRGSHKITVIYPSAKHSILNAIEDC
jgi:hypothetical protein